MLAAAAAALIALVGCGSSKSTGAKAGDDGGPTYTLGVLADITGPAASAGRTQVDGVKAGTILASRQGYKIKYIVADTQTSPTATLAAATKLVTQDHVFAVIANSSLTFAASAYLTAHQVPVIGTSIDGPEWITSKNMFSVIGAIHGTYVGTTPGKFLKMQGVSSLAAVGYGISPSSSESARTTVESAKAAGIKVGYLNAQVPFGSTDVGPLVLAMKAAKVDGFFASTDPNTAFAVISGLNAQGVKLKAALMFTGYGGDLIQAGPGALEAAQNVYFGTLYEPVELQTAATKQFVADLKSAGVQGAPTFAQYNGYVSIGLFLRAVKAAGKSPTQASLLSALSAVHDFDALGLFGGQKVDINNRANLGFGVHNCLYFVKLVGKTFKMVSGADPLCGDVIPGLTVPS
ncbi:ABC transporter substrate-binding protein [Pseudofrankia inefficax]|nr:ABC transporter substrate-binding protein [Pseudofrankia inefficax]